MPDCPPLPAKWWRDPEILVAEVKRHGDNRAAAARAHDIETGSKPHLLSKAWADFGLQARPSGRPAKSGDGLTRARREYESGVFFGRDGRYADVVTEPTPYKLGDLAALIAERGLDPDEWIIDSTILNEWDGNAGMNDDGKPVVVKLRQLKIRLKPKQRFDWLFPASEVEKRWRPPRRKRSAKKSLLAVVCSDQQAPYHDEGLHDAFCRWLADAEPDIGGLAGDTMDLPTISRHADRPNWNAEPQECIDRAYGLLSDYRDASAKTRWQKLLGNHDIRIHSEQLARAERLFGLKPAAIPGEEQVAGNAIRRLLHLDALAIDLVGTEGEKWELAEMTLAPGVSVRHRLPTKEKAGRLSRTILAGDSHRQSIRAVTFWDGEEPRTEYLVEVGCMCSLDGLGYTYAPDWQRGFATVQVFPDGTPPAIDLARWDGSKLTWRGQVW